MRRLRPLLAWLLPTAALLAALALQLSAPIPVQALRHAAFDQFQRWHPRPYTPAPVRIVDIDEESLARLGQWPWSRTRLAELVEQLQAGGAAGIAFDVVFAEPDRTAPAALAAAWQLPESQARGLRALPDPDQRFAEAIRAAPVVLGFTLEQTATRSGPADHTAGSMPASTSASGSGQAPIGHAGFIVRGAQALDALPDFTVASLPIAALRDAASGLGTISFRPDADGIVRRVPLLMRLNGAPVPGLTVELLRVAQQTRTLSVLGLPGSPGLSALRVAGQTLPSTPDGEAWIHYTPPEPARSVPAWRVIAGEAPPMPGALVLVGSSAKGLLDLRLNPLGTVMPGVEAHAQFLEQAHSGAFLIRPDWAAAAEATALVVVGLGVTGLALHAGPLLSASIALLALAGMLAGSWAAFLQSRLLLDPMLPALGVLAAFVLASVVRHRASEQRHRWIRHAFSRYVSPNLVSHLIDNPGQLVLGGRRQECSFIFTDLAGFTSLMERNDPAGVVSLLNDYLDGMIRIVFKHEGTLDRIIGDALAVVFSAPVEQADHRERAYACALDLHRFAVAHAASLAAQGVPFGHTRIGVHAGEVIVGNFGGSTIFDYRALGDPVNTAARLESLNKQLGTLVCVSEVIRDACPDAPMRPVGRVVLKGRSNALLVYEPLLDASGAPASAPDLAYEQAYARMTVNAPDAVAAFESLVSQRPDDRLAAWQLARLRTGWEADRIVMQEK